MGDTSATLMWFTRDLRLRDLPALDAALRDGGPVIPVFIAETADVERAGAASRWRQAQSLKALAADIAGLGGRLVLRTGDPVDVLASLAREVGAQAVRKTESRIPAAFDQEARVSDALARVGARLVTHPGRFMIGPQSVQTKAGGFFRVYTPFWRAVSALADPGEPLAPPSRWPAPERHPASLDVSELALEAAMNRGADVLAPFAPAGEAAAEDRLAQFLDERVAAYSTARDRLDEPGTSMLSAHLAAGEISPRRIWAATRAAVAADPAKEAGGEVFLKEIVWREFAWHLAAHTPHLLDANWRSEWDAFPWDGESAASDRWMRGRTGVDVVDAAMRELYVTGVMHNRARMLTASYLTKHLLTDWRVGEAWFRDCLVDFDPASNAMGWQWAAGSGPDAAPFFRIFNPDTQAEKFDPQARYRTTWLPERFERVDAGDLFAKSPDPQAVGGRFFEAAPRSWALDPRAPRPDPVISLSEGRARALAAYEAVKG